MVCISWVWIYSWLIQLLWKIWHYMQHVISTEISFAVVDDQSLIMILILSGYRSSLSVDCWWPVVDGSDREPRALPAALSGQHVPVPKRSVSFLIEIVFFHSHLLWLFYCLYCALRISKFYAPRHLSIHRSDLCHNIIQHMLHGVYIYLVHR